MILKYSSYVLVGIIAGAINSVAGGGTILAFPLLIFFGMSAISANATTNIPVVIGQFSSALGYKKYIKKIPIGYFLLLIPVIIGTFLGAYLLTRTNNNTFEFISPFLILFAVLIFGYQPYIVARIYGSIYSKNIKYYPPTWLYSVIFILSIYGGYYGGGFGLTVLALLSITSLKNIHVMNGLKNILSTIEALVSAIVLFSSGLINWRVGLVLGFGALLGGYFGAKFAQNLSLRYLRFVIIIIGLFTAIYFIAIANHISFGNIFKI